MDVKDWSAGGKESFTTPGGPFQPPKGELGRVYEYSRGKPRSAPAAQSADEAPKLNEAPGLEASAVQSGVNPQGGPIYTIRLPATPKPPAPKRRSLRWLPLALVGALLLGLLLGLLTAAPGAETPTPTRSSERTADRAAGTVTDRLNSGPDGCGPDGLCFTLSSNQGRPAAEGCFDPDLAT